MTQIMATKLKLQEGLFSRSAFAINLKNKASFSFSKCKRLFCSRPTPSVMLFDGGKSLRVDGIDGKETLNLEQSTETTELHSFTILLPAILSFMTADASGEPSYSLASYYTSLGLFVLSVPGVWSLIKRSTKSKIVKKNFVVEGPAVEGAKPLSKVAGEITAFLTRRNFAVVDRGEVATFEGVITPNRSQAAFLVFCSALSLLSVALVLTITVPSVGDNWYYITVLSPLSGLYYWRRATRTEQVKVKLVVADDEKTADVIIQGDDEEVNMLRKELNLMEKGMVYVKGILEQ